MGLLHDGQFPPRTMGNVPEHKQCPSDFLLGSERAEEYAFSLYGTSSTFWNRLVRTRMLGGVRGRGLAAPSYSISRFRPFALLTMLQTGHPIARQPLAVAASCGAVVPTV